MYRSRSLNLDQQHCINLYLELAENKQGKQKGMLLMAPGLDPLLALTGTLTPVSPPPPPPGSQAIYIPGQSCELFRFPLTASGLTTPDVNITGTTSTLTGPLGNANSNTLAVDVDTATGNQYVMQQSKQSGDNLWDINIPVFAKNATGNVAPIHNILPTNAGMIDQAIELNFGGICLDGSKNIYVGFQGGDRTDIYKFAAGSDGSTTGTLLITDATLFCTSLAYDSTNNLIWVGGYATLGGAAQAQSYSTAGVLNSTLTTSAMVFPGEIFIGPTGQIILAGISPSDGTKSVVQVFPSGSSGAAAASQTLTISATQGPAVSCAAMDSLGLLYVGPIASQSPGFTENINVYAAGATGVNPTVMSTFNSPLFVQMADTTPTNIQQIVVR